MKTLRDKIVASKMYAVLFTVAFVCLAIYTFPGFTESLK